MNQFDFTVAARKMCGADSGLHLTVTGEGFNVTLQAGSGKLQVQFENDRVFFDYFELRAEVTRFAVPAADADEAALRRAVAPLLINSN